MAKFKINKELRNNVMEWLDRHPGTKVLAGGLTGGVTGNLASRLVNIKKKDADHSAGTISGAILGALAANADNVSKDAKSIQEGQMNAKKLQEIQGKQMIDFNKRMKRLMKDKKNSQSTSNALLWLNLLGNNNN